AAGRSGRPGALGAGRSRRGRRQQPGATRPRRRPRLDGLPRRRARQPPPDARGDERPAAPDGGHRALRPVQPRPPHVAPGDDEGTRRAVPARPFTLASFSDFPFPAVPSDMTDSSSPPPEPPNKPPV